MPTQGVQQTSLCNRFTVVDCASDQISQTAICIRTGCIPQAERSDSWQPCAVDCGCLFFLASFYCLRLVGCDLCGRPHFHPHLSRPSSFLLPSRFQKMSNGSLVIRDVTTDDTGRYTCVAGNSCSIKDRVAQLYVVGEFITYTHKHIQWLSLSGTKLHTWGISHDQKYRMKALIKPSPSARHPTPRVNNLVTEVLGLGRR